MTNGRKQCRTGDRCQPRSLAEVIYHLVHHSAIDARAIAEQLGVRYGYLLDAANPDREDLRLQARHVVSLTQITRDTSLLDFMEHQLGRVAVRVPDAETQLALSQTAIATFSQLLTAWCTATTEGDDGTVTVGEVETFERQADAAIAAIASMKLKMRRSLPATGRPDLRSA